jgi:uncharacterized protein (TIGR02246 family)
MNRNFLVGRITVKNLLKVFLVTVLLIPNSCTKKVDTQADVEAIKKLAQNYDEAVNNGDADSFSSCFADDVIQMPTGQPQVIGKEAIYNSAKVDFQKITSDLKGTVERIDIAGDWAFLRAIFVEPITQKVSGETITYYGSWVLILKKQDDGSWKIFYDIWNNDKPPVTEKL